MSSDEDDDELWREKMLATMRNDRIRAWVINPSLPKPELNAQNGWALDQFAMHVDSDHLRLWKDRAAHEVQHPEKTFDYNWSLLVEIELKDKIMSHLLQCRYKVTGIPLGQYEPIVIVRPILEIMHPSIATSELIENTAIRPKRRFEQVRVFDQTGSRKAAGRKEDYDWPALVKTMETEKPTFRSEADLVSFCRKSVQAKPGKRVPIDGAADKTTREAISRYGLKKFISKSE